MTGTLFRYFLKRHLSVIFWFLVGVTGLVMTKLDGTAKGGIVLAIADTLKLPIRYIGIGETAADFDVFDAEAFVDAVLRPAAGAAA